MRTSSKRDVVHHTIQTPAGSKKIKFISRFREKNLKKWRFWFPVPERGTSRKSEKNNLYFGPFFV
jgi:hypothetical protein